MPKSAPTQMCHDELYPLLPFQPPVDQPRNDQVDAPNSKITKLPFQLRHEFKVHPVHPHQKRQGQEDQRNRRQALHRLVHPVAHEAHKEVLEVAGTIKVGFGFVDGEGEVLFEVDKFIFEFLPILDREMVVDLVDHVVGLDREFGDAVEGTAGKIEAFLHLLLIKIL